MSLSETEVSTFLDFLNEAFGYDFRQYAQASLTRRLSHVCQMMKIENLTDLRQSLVRDPDLFPQVLSHVTVSTSEMFRDPQTFSALREHVLPRLRSYPSINIWHAGCSTGEEVFSLLILLKEEGLLERTQVYATDIDPCALAKAKSAIFSLETIQEGTRNYQQAGGTQSFSTYYKAQYRSAIMDRSLLNNVLFTEHNLVTDQVFAQMQLVLCRNVLIYFSRDLQDKAMRLFNDSLCHNGFLVIGSKESMKFSTYFQNFSEFDKKNKIFQKGSG